MAKLAAPFLIGLFFYFSHFFFDLPEGLSAQAWLYLSIFVGLIIGLILEPVAPALLGLGAVALAVIFKVGPANSGEPDKLISAAAAIKWGLAGFSDSVVWLIFAAFTIGLGFSKTGLGERVALFLVAKLGRSTLGLGYAISLVDLILAPFIPSNAARSGGTVYPIVRSIAPIFESLPDKNPRKIGAYLVWVGLSSCCVSSSIFLTGQAPNPLALSLISQNGVAVVDWLGWFVAFLPVGLILFLITPLLGYFLYPPELKGSAEISKWASDKYAQLGPLPRSQLLMILIALAGLVLWVGASFFKINATTTALVMIILMMAGRILTWQDFLANKAAWNTLVWFATLVTMAGGLKNVGFLSFLASALGSHLVGFSPFVAMILLLMLFSWLRYFFASGTAYVTAIIAIFVSLAASINEGDPALIMLILVLPMGFMGVITPYGTGCSPLWFGSGYVRGPQFFLLGGVFAGIYMLVYLFVGLSWVEFISPFLNFH